MAYISAGKLLRLIWDLSAVKLHWHFTWGFDFRHGLKLPFAADLSVSKRLKDVAELVKKDFGTWITSSIICRNRALKAKITSGNKID